MIAPLLVLRGHRGAPVPPAAPEVDLLDTAARFDLPMDRDVVLQLCAWWRGHRESDDFGTDGEVAIRAARGAK